MAACMTQLHALPFTRGSLTSVLTCENPVPIMNHISTFLGSFFSPAYASLCLAFSIDRFCAVYFPMTFSTKRPRLFIVLITACFLYSIIYSVETTFNPFGMPRLLAILFWLGTLVVMFVAIAVFYVAIVCKLWGMKRKTSNRVAPATSTDIQMTER